MRRGEQQKILHKGSKKKVNVFITLLYPLNGIKFNTSKTRNSSDFIHHLNSIKICKKKEHQEIHTCNRQCIISCKQKDKTIYRKTIKLVNCTISTNTSTIPKYSRNKSKQKSEKRCMCKLQLRNRRKSIICSKKIS